MMEFRESNERLAIPQGTAVVYYNAPPNGILPDSGRMKVTAHDKEARLFGIQADHFFRRSTDKEIRRFATSAVARYLNNR